MYQSQSQSQSQSHLLFLAARALGTGHWAGPAFPARLGLWSGKPARTSHALMTFRSWQIKRSALLVPAMVGGRICRPYFLSQVSVTLKDSYQSAEGN